ncbi:MAG: toll/interleukin-1 receptor domain-containing protein [Erysipelotrichales bacterium]|nr:toll/interleukin-1 receptor domain-containing protein [Erysipelotrichales bacterium]
MKGIYIGISYATEQQNEVNKFVSELDKLNVNYFYDEQHPELFWGEFAPEILNKIYKQCNWVVAFVSNDYMKKSLPLFEMNNAFYYKMQDLENKKRFLPIIYDGVELPEYLDGYFYLKRDKYELDEIAKILVKKIQSNKKNTTLKSIVKTSLKSFNPHNWNISSDKNEKNFLVKHRGTYLFQFNYDKKAKIYYVLNQHDVLMAAIKCTTDIIKIYNYGLFFEALDEISTSYFKEKLIELWERYEKN